MVSQRGDKPAGKGAIRSDTDVFEALTVELVDNIVAAKNVEIVRALLEDRTNPRMTQTISFEKADKSIAGEFQGPAGV